MTIFQYIEQWLISASEFLCGYPLFFLLIGGGLYLFLRSGAVSVRRLPEAVRVLQDVEGIGICELTNQDVVRHVMVQRIIKAYEDYEKRRSGGDNRGKGKR